MYDSIEGFTIVVRRFVILRLFSMLANIMLNLTSTCRPL